VLGISIALEAGSFLVAFKEFNKTRGQRGFFEALFASKDPVIPLVLLEDTGAVLGLVIAFASILVTAVTKRAAFDGVGSILIGIVLAVTAILLARESKSLLVGEQADRKLNEAITRIAAGEPNVERVNGVMTAQLAPDQILAALSIEFPDALTTAQIEQQVLSLEHKLRDANPAIVTVFVKPQTKTTFEETVRRRYGTELQTQR
jgi:divalent metal cation (Fe/Co/Zn/Cd) transporter